MKHALPRYILLVPGLLPRLLPARAQALPGIFAAGPGHSLRIHADGTLWVTGTNKYGQLGISTSITRSDAWVQVGTATN